MKMKKLLIICLTLLLTSCSNILSTETIYECSGKFTTKSGKLSEATELAMRFTKYRSIVSLWSDSGGMIKGEFRIKPAMYSVLYLDIKIVGDQIQLYNDSKFTKIAGYFNLLNRVVELSTYRGFYYGECVETDR